jgi:hypothetical protein
MIQALRPRLQAPPAPNRFGITGITGITGIVGSATRSSTADLSAEAWEMARLLAEIARIKYTHIARAIPWTAAMVVLGVAVTVVGG